MFSVKVLELIAKAIGDYFSGTEIIDILESQGIPTSKIDHPNTKWRTILGVFNGIRNYQIYSGKKHGSIIAYDNEGKIASIVSAFLHPLNHNADEEKAESLAKKIEKIIKYDKLILYHADDKYIITDQDGLDNLQYDEHIDEMGKDHDVYQRQLALQQNDEKLISSNKALLEEIYSLHQTYINLLELFCDNPTKPTEKTNSAYLYLTNKLLDKTRELGTKYYTLDLYIPFERDLYSAEKEWGNDVLKGRISWIKMRPNLHYVHSNIAQLYAMSKGDTAVTGDKKSLKEITDLISEQQTKKTLPVTAKPTPVHKIEITGMPDLQFSNAEGSTLTKGKKESAYITKEGDDFHYKGRYLNLSKKSDYYKVFCALFAKLPSGGEVSYKDLIAEVKSRLPKTQDKTDDEMKKFIQRNLTDKSNGFMRYAGIPETEDNGKPLMEVVRGSGILFNNKTG